MELFSLIMIIFGGFALSRVIIRAYSKSITRREYLFWCVIWVSVIGVGFFPKLSFIIANFFGIARGADFMMYVSVIVLFYMVFKLYVKLEESEKKKCELVRKMAINQSKEKKKKL